MKDSLPLLLFLSTCWRQEPLRSFPVNQLRRFREFSQSRRERIRKQPLSLRSIISSPERCLGPFDSLGPASRDTTSKEARIDRVHWRTTFSCDLLFSYSIGAATSMTCPSIKPGQHNGFRAEVRKNWSWISCNCHRCGIGIADRSDTGRQLDHGPVADWAETRQPTCSEQFGTRQLACLQQMHLPSPETVSHFFQMNSIEQEQPTYLVLKLLMSHSAAMFDFSQNSLYEVSESS